MEFQTKALYPAILEHLIEPGLGCSQGKPGCERVAGRFESFRTSNLPQVEVIRAAGTTDEALQRKAAPGDASCLDGAILAAACLVCQLDRGDFDAEGWRLLSIGLAS